MAPNSQQQKPMHGRIYFLIVYETCLEMSRLFSVSLEVPMGLSLRMDARGLQLVFLRLTEPLDKRLGI